MRVEAKNRHIWSAVAHMLEGGREVAHYESSEGHNRSTKFSDEEIRERREEDRRRIKEEKERHRKLITPDERFSRKRCTY